MANRLKMVKIHSIQTLRARGKRGVGACKSTVGAVGPFLRLRKRNSPKPTDRLFPKGHRQLFNQILDEQGLKFDREGNRRTAYSLRHTYICLRLMEGGRHLSDLQELPHKRRDDPEILRHPPQKHARRVTVR